MGELKQGSDPHIRATVLVRGGTFQAESETADLWQPKWNENQIVLATAIQTPDRDAGPLEGTAAGSWSLGIVEQSQGEETVDCGETDREEIVVGNACGRKLGSHGSKEILLSYV